MIPAYQMTNVALIEQQHRDAEREKRYLHGELGTNPADFARHAPGPRRGGIVRALARLVQPAQRPSAA
jgi:hypothetical protein